MVLILCLSFFEPLPSGQETTDESEPPDIVLYRCPALWLEQGGQHGAGSETGSCKSSSLDFSFEPFPLFKTGGILSRDENFTIVRLLSTRNIVLFQKCFRFNLKLLLPLLLTTALCITGLHAAFYDTWLCYDDTHT